METLVTGAYGFLGRYVLQALENENHSVHSLGMEKESDVVANIVNEIPPIKETYGCVIHVAGKAHLVPKTEAEKQAFYDVNVQGTKNVLNALETPPKYFVFISTVSVYGLDFGENIPEDHPLNAVEPYGKSKIMAEEIISEWGKENDVIITILRLPLLFGNNPPGNLKSMINSIQKKYYFNIGKGDVRKSMVFAADVAAFIPTIMLKGGTYNLTDGYHPSFKELSDIISDFYGIKKPISIPSWIILFIANCFELLQRIFRINLPIDRKKFKKITHSLTFEDKKARKEGWSPRKVINFAPDWLSQ